jgi:hypothetical protein
LINIPKHPVARYDDRNFSPPKADKPFDKLSGVAALYKIVTRFYPGPENTEKTFLNVVPDGKVQPVP